MEKFIPDPARLQAVEENWKRVLDRVQEGAVKSGRDPREVRLMAVTKTVEPVYINRALDLGADLIGENRVQEYLGKRDELHLDGVEKHLIGRLQTNKVKYIVGQVDMIQSVDSMKLAQEISKQSVKHGVTTRVLVEVNIGREESKSGIMIEALPELLEEAAQKPGKATIVANTYTTTLRCDVTVVSNVGRVTLNQERLYLENIGGTAALRASVAVENGDAVPITWTTSNPAAATVDPFGLVTAVGDGEALITATTPDGHSACCNVYCGTQVAIQEQIEADEAKIALGVLGGFAVLVGALALAVSGS